MSEYQSKNRDSEVFELQRSANSILEFVGLSLEDLPKKDLVVDLGCGQAEVGRAAKFSGNKSIISIAADTPRNILGIDFRKMNALEEISLPPNSIKLLFSRNGPHVWNYNRPEAEKLFQEINKVLNPEGEARFYVPWLGFIQLRIANELKIGDERQKLQGVWRRLSKQTDWGGRINSLTATQAKLKLTKPYLMQAMQESTKFLQELGYNLSLVDNPKHPGEVEFKFWLLKKSQAVKD